VAFELCRFSHAIADFSSSSNEAFDAFFVAEADARFIQRDSSGCLRR
jgi:hypothetical protein